MADFTVSGFWLFNGTDFSVSTSTGDVNIEAFGLARFDSAFGGAGNVAVANSNATHFQQGNPFCAIDMSCTTFTHAGTGQFTINAGAIQQSIGGVGVFFADNSQVVVGESGKSLLERGTTYTAVYSGNTVISSSGGIMSFNCPVVQISAAGATSITIGNIDPSTVVAINSNELQVFTTATMDFQCQGATTICTSAGSSLDIGNAVCAMTLLSSTFSLIGAGTIAIETASGNLELGTTPGGGDVLISSAVRTFLEATTVLELVCTNGNVNMLVNSVHTITIDGELGAHATVSIASANSDFLNLGNSLCAVSVSADTWSLNTGGTLHLGSGSPMTIESGSSILVQAPTVNINTDALTNETHIGNALPGNTLFIDTKDIQIGNSTTFTQTGNVAWSATGSLNISVTGVLQLQSSASNVTVAGPTLGLNDSASARVTTIGAVTAGNIVDIASEEITLSNLAGSAPVGSIAVLWDPVGKRLYHV